jgi:hypothetical protein
MLPLNPLQSWVFLILSFTTIGMTVRSIYWKQRYWDAERTRIYIAKLKGYESTRIDDVYRKSFFQD